MEGEQLPKATMNSFVKNHTTIPYSADFVNKLLHVSKEFVVRISDKANEICEQNNKKTISAEHLEQALESFGLAHHINKLREVGTNIKEINQLKREASQRLEENIEREMREERERRQNEEPEKKEVTERERFEVLEAVELEDKGDDEDYENIAEEEHPQKPEPMEEEVRKDVPPEE